MKVLPEAFLKLMTPEDRKAIGQMSAEEAILAFTAKSERKLQSQIVQLLRLKGIEVLWHRTDKKSAATVGWPDLTFSLISKERFDGEIHFLVCPNAWEIKMPGGKLSPEQEKMAIRLQEPPNFWRYRLITSVDEALKELRQMGIQ